MYTPILFSCSPYSQLYGRYWVCWPSSASISVCICLLMCVQHVYVLNSTHFHSIPLSSTHFHSLSHRVCSGGGTGTGAQWCQPDWLHQMQQGCTKANAKPGQQCHHNWSHGRDMSYYCSVYFRVSEFFNRKCILYMHMHISFFVFIPAIVPMQTTRHIPTHTHPPTHPQAAIRNRAGTALSAWGA